MNPRITLLGIPIDAVSMEQAVQRIGMLLQSSQQHLVCTPNPEMLVEASRSPKFTDLLRRSTLNTADGGGLLWAARRCGGALPERVTGTDMVSFLAALPDARIFLLGAAPGVAERAAEALKQRVSGADIVGTFSGSPGQRDASDILGRINESGATLLLVAFGAPTQELWIDQYLSQMPSVRVAIGVGGAFDFLAGKRKRAPLFLRRIGLEWFWRLMQEPSRLPRIFTATIRFPLLVLRYRSASPLHADDQLR